jgi:hypothetical protein
MTATDTHVWMVPVTPEVAALSTTDAKALLLGSTFARRMERTDPEHRGRMCDHGHLLGAWTPCRFCQAGVPAMTDAVGS